MSEVVILREALTCYVIHGSNLYVSAGSGKAGLRRKQQVMAALASSLREALRAQGLLTETVDCVVEVVQAEADQFRLLLDGGAPWQTVRAEHKLFKILHSDASKSQTLFRAFSMIPALLLPPRWFYAGRQWLGKKQLVSEYATRNFAGASRSGCDDYRGVEDLSLHADYDTWSQHIFDLKPNVKIQIARGIDSKCAC